MEGLLLAEVLRRLATGLPAARSTWRFPDDRTCEFTLADGSVLSLESRPPNPRLTLNTTGSQPPQGRSGRQSPSRPGTPFQAQLAARGVGDLVGVSQPRLDRIVTLDFAGSDDFVPSPPVRLVFELTGRNSNLVLVDAAGAILGVEREVSAERSRSRRLSPGLTYEPPAPQDKLDPRTTERATLLGALGGRAFGEVRTIVDGIGPRLEAALATATGLERGDELLGEKLEALVTEIEVLVAGPAAYLMAHRGDSDAPNALSGAAQARAGVDERSKLIAEAKRATSRELKTLRARLADAERALSESDLADSLRAEADLLLARAAEVAPGTSSVALAGFDGTELTIELDPRLSAADNAQARYQRARRISARARAAHGSLPELRAAEVVLSAELAAVEDGDAAALEMRLAKTRKAGARRASESSAGRGPTRVGGGAGLRLTDPRGYEVYVGRSAKENDAITFKLARSRDVWLHAQGYRGAHVVVRAQAAEVPFETVLFAARLAAGYSEARRSDNVPVDYTMRKNVWRVKGGAPGAVHYAHQKTVYVDPARDAEAAGSAG